MSRGASPRWQAAAARPERPLLRVAEVAAMLGVSKRVAYAWVAAGVLPREVVLRAGRAVYVKRLALERWLAGGDGVDLPTADKGVLRRG
jgi:excisionase family DNA binding protein